MRRKEIRTIILGILMVACVGAAEAQNGFDHQYLSWQTVLNTYTSNGKVKYKAIAADAQKFKEAGDELENVPTVDFDQFNVQQKKAFWINAYNIGAFKLILNNYPIKTRFGLKALTFPQNSIQQIPNVWNQPILTLLGEKLSLDDIENKILRPEFKDPRIHFAIVCASIGCPVIRSEAYTAEKLDQQLSEQIKLFLSDPLKAHYDKITDVLYLSPIFKWFKTDFEPEGGAVGFIKSYAPAGLFDGISQQSKIQWLGYDWNLNDK